MGDNPESNVPTADRENDGVVQPRAEESNEGETNNVAVRSNQPEKQKRLTNPFRDYSEATDESASAVAPVDEASVEPARNPIARAVSKSDWLRKRDKGGPLAPAERSSQLGKRQLAKYRKYLQYAEDDSGGTSVPSKRFTISEGANNATPEGAALSNFSYGPVANMKTTQGVVQPRVSPVGQASSNVAGVPVAGQPLAMRMYQFRSDHMSKVLKKFDCAVCKFQQLSVFDAQTGIATKIAKGLWLSEGELSELQRLQEALSHSHERVKLASADVISRKIWAKAPHLTALEVWIISRYIRNLKPLLCCIHDVQLFMPASEMADDNWLSALTGEWLTEAFRGETMGLPKFSWLERWIRHTSPTFHYLLAEFIERNLPLARVLATSDYPPQELARADVIIIGQLLCRIARYSQMADNLPPIPFPRKPNPMRVDHPEVVFDNVQVLELTFPPTPTPIIPGACLCGSDSSHEKVEDLPRFEDTLPGENQKFLSLAIGYDEGGDSHAPPEDLPGNFQDEYKQAVLRAAERVGNISASETELFWDAVKQEMPATTVDIERLPKGLLSSEVDWREIFPMEYDPPLQMGGRPKRVAKTKANEFIKQIAGCDSVLRPNRGPALRSKDNVPSLHPRLLIPTNQPWILSRPAVFSSETGLLYRGCWMSLSTRM